MGSKEQRQAAIAEADALLTSDEATQEDENLNTGSSKDAENAHQDEGTPPQGDSEQLWESKYRVLQGKYNAEVKRLNDEIKRVADAPTNNQELSNLKQEIDSLKSQLAKANEAKPEQVDDAVSKDEYYQSLESELGPDLAKTIMGVVSNARGSGTTSNDEVNKLRQQVQNIEQQNSQQAENQKYSTINAMLQSKGIDFELTNNDPAFVEWLNLEEGSTGQPRLTFMNNHFANGDLERTAAYFVAFKAQERSNFDKNPLSQHAVANGSSAADQPNADEDIWTGEMVNQLYADKKQGRISEQDFLKYEAELARASAEGRIRP